MKKHNRKILSEKFTLCGNCAAQGKVWANGFWGSGLQTCRRCNGHGQVVLVLVEEERKVRD